MKSNVIIIVNLVCPQSCVQKCICSCPQGKLALGSDKVEDRLVELSLKNSHCLSLSLRVV